MQAITELRKTGYYVTYGEYDATFLDGEGHMWFTKDIARDHAMRLRGMYFNGQRNTVKEVVVAYQ